MLARAAATLLCNSNDTALYLVAPILGIKFYWQCDAALALRHARAYLVVGRGVKCVALL